jgi:hypothetical protein
VTTAAEILADSKAAARRPRAVPSARMVLYRVGRKLLEASLAADVEIERKVAVAMLREAIVEIGE